MASTQNNKAIVYAQVPNGLVTVNDFAVEDRDAPAASDEAPIVVKLVHVSVDPYMRGRMRDPSIKSYAPAWAVGEPGQGGVVVEVIESGDDAFPVGSHAVSQLPWVLYQAVPAAALRLLPKADELPAGFRYSQFVGACGMTGLSALCPIAEWVEEEDMTGKVCLVSGAAGAVGSVACGVLKARGARVIGSAGSDAKVAHLLEDLGLDAAFNYKTGESYQANVVAALADLGADGIDFYWDNVGGESLEAALNTANAHALFILCGAISGYNASAEERYGLTNSFQIITKRLTVKGFIVTDFAATFGERSVQLVTMVATGKIKAHETVVDGFESIPEALCNLFAGTNTGKMVVDC